MENSLLATNHNVKCDNSCALCKPVRFSKEVNRHVYTVKVMRIGSELIRIVCVHTECALTAIRIECAFGQSTFIGGLKPV